MLSRKLWSFVVALWLVASAAVADTLPLADNLIDLRSSQGEQLLRDGGALESYVPLSLHFVTQKTQTFCGVASSVMVLNALQVPAPTTPEYEPFHLFTQDNFLNERTEAVLPVAVLSQRGMTLDQLGQLLALQPVDVEVHHAADSSLDAFRSAAMDSLGHGDRAVIINYLRSAIGQQSGGHISPLGGYDAAVDRFLVLDVARYKYPPVWVKAAELFQAMNTPDADNQGRTRGFVLVTKAASAAATPPH